MTDYIPPLYRPPVFAVTMTEGGNYIAFPCPERNCRGGILVHSLHFTDGTEWDAYNGWRPWRRTAEELDHIRKLIA